MADLRAFEAVTDGVFGILRGSRSHLDMSEQPEFKAITAPEMHQRPVTMGVTLMVHEVVPVPTLRAPSSDDRAVSASADAMTFEMRFLLTVWSNEGPVEQRLAAWVAESMLLHPVLTADELNRTHPDCFAAADRVSLLHATMPFAELMALWTAIGGGRFRLSLPYAARGIRLDPAE